MKLTTIIEEIITSLLKPNLDKINVSTHAHTNIMRLAVKNTNKFMFFSFFSLL